MMSHPSRYLLATLVVTLATLTVGVPPAQAADNDIVLSRFAEFQKQTNNCEAVCGNVAKNTEQFENLVHDFGQVMSPRFGAPASTLGEAGFAVDLAPTLSIIDNDAEHWNTGVEDRDPESVMFVPGLIVRKGLPFSFEVAGTMGHISGSDMFTVGSQVKWSLHEGFRLFPDVAARGMVNTVVGSRDLQMLTAGWDISISKGFPLAGVLTITPYGGYQQLHIWGWSRLLNVRPQDPRAPVTGEGGNPGFNPEFVFDTHHTAVNRGFLGGRLNIWTVSLSLEGVLGEDVHQFSALLGMDF